MTRIQTYTHIARLNNSNKSRHPFIPETLLHWSVTEGTIRFEQRTGEEENKNTNVSRNENININLALFASLILTPRTLCTYCFMLLHRM